MSMTMPPGWYPDPGHAGEGPPPERWWDGTTWSGRTRPAGTADEEPTTPRDPGDGTDAAGQPPGPPEPGAAWGDQSGHGTDQDQPWLLPQPLSDDELLAPAGRRAWRVAGIVAAVVAAAALVAGGVLLATTVGEDSGDERAAERDDPAPDGAEDGEGGPAQDPEGGDGPDGAEEFTEAGVAEVLLPIPEGWSEHPFTGAAVTAGEYPCPEDAERTCVRAGAFLSEAEGDDPRTVAEEDVVEHAAASYGEGTHGAVAGQHEERAEEVTVAGGTGYRVRLRVETGAGDEAYAESVAFAAPDGSGQLLVLRLGWADAPGAPSGEDMDALVDSVRPAPPGGAGTEV